MIAVLPILETTMNMFAAIIITLAIIASILFFDHVIVFLLSGSLPFINVTLPATTMLAIMIASTVTVIALRRRHAVYQNCLELYDEFFRLKKRKDDTPTSQAPKLPRRRYQEL